MLSHDCIYSRYRSNSHQLLSKALMSNAPLIGITGKRRSGADLRGNLEVMSDLQLDVYWVDYAQGILAAGGVPVFLPLGVDPALYIERIDGLLMSGGADIQP